MGARINQHNGDYTAKIEHTGQNLNIQRTACIFESTGSKFFLKLIKQLLASPF